MVITSAAGKRTHEQSSPFSFSLTAHKAVDDTTETTKAKANQSPNDAGTFIIIIKFRRVGKKEAKDKTNK
jgi:hypothetical protein